MGIRKNRHITNTAEAKQTLMMKNTHTWVMVEEFRVFTSEGETLKPALCGRPLHPSVSRNWSLPPILQLWVHRGVHATRRIAASTGITRMITAVPIVQSRWPGRFHLGKRRLGFVDLCPEIFSNILQFAPNACASLL